MADWYCSSTQYAGYTAFQATHAYSVGNLIVPTAPALKAKWVFRCTTAGTSTTEPSWNTANNGTSTSGTAVFTNVTGQSGQGWNAAAGDLATLCTTNNRLAGGDNVYISSDHTETQTASTNYGSGTSIGTPSFSVIKFISVNKAGSVPPIAADVLAGAAINSSSNISFFIGAPCFYSGITFTSSNAAAAAMNINGSGVDYHTLYFQNCTLSVSANSSLPVMLSSSSALYGRVILDNTILSFGNSSQKLASSAPAGMELIWKNTPIAGAIAGTVPNNLIQNSSAGPCVLTLRGIDVSAVTSTLVTGSGSSAGIKVLFDSCKVAGAATRFSAGTPKQDNDEVEYVNCFDGTNIINERYTSAGNVTTETTITLSGGAADDVGSFSHKMVSGTNVDKFVNPLEGFWFDVDNTLTSGSRTATVEIISSGTLNNDDISLELFYEGTSGSPLYSYVNDFIATPLTTAAAVTSSTATWNSSPSTPQAQKLQCTFAPLHAGRLKGRVRLGKASTTVYVNPQISVA